MARRPRRHCRHESQSLNRQPRYKNHPAALVPPKGRDGVGATVVAGLDVSASAVRARAETLLFEGRPHAEEQSILLDRGDGAAPEPLVHLQGEI